MSEFLPRTRPVHFGTFSGRQDGSIPGLSLQEASARLADLTRKTALPAPRDAIISKDPNLAKRASRRRMVRERFGMLYNFWNETESTHPSSVDEALLRYETMTYLLVHPTVDKVMTAAVDAIDLPMNSVLCVTGSVGNGAAQVSTLAARDRGFEHVKFREGSPDVDTAFISQSPVPKEVRTTYKQDLDEILITHGLHSCIEHTPINRGYSIEAIEAQIKDTLHYGPRGLECVFDPAYPKNVASQMRKNMINKLTLLGQENPDRHQEIVKRLAKNKGEHLSLKDKHFAYRVPEEEFLDISNYFRDRIMSVFGDLLAMTNPQIPPNPK